MGTASDREVVVFVVKSRASLDTLRLARRITRQPVMKTLLLLTLSLSLLLTPSVSAQRSSTQTQVAADMSKYIGLRHGPSLPAGLKNIGGALVSEVNDSKEYAISKVHKGRIKMLWFDRLTHHDDRGVAYWELKDVLVLPPIPRNQIVVYRGCLLEYQPDNEIAAVVTYEAGVQYFTRVHKAWRANRSTEKFEVIPMKGIKCESEGYGI